MARREKIPKLYSTKKIWFKKNVNYDPYWISSYKSFPYVPKEWKIQALDEHTTYSVFLSVIVKINLVQEEVWGGSASILFPFKSLSPNY